MKVLLSALACEPGRGSELEVGYRAMLAAAREHEVWVLTNADAIPALSRTLADREEAQHIHLVGIESGLDEASFSRLTVSAFTGTTTAGNVRRRRERSSSSDRSDSTSYTM